MASVIDDLVTRYNKTIIDNSLETTRNENHNLYYSIDINFLNKVDSKYLDKANDIIKRYKLIDVNKILLLNSIDSDNLKKELKTIIKDINKLKQTIKLDLATVIDYVDNVADRLDLYGIKKDNPLGILILNKYESFKIYSANIDFSDLNAAMKRQSKRLIYLKELDYLINVYKKNNSKYNKENTNILINNLYDIIGKYLFLLTNNEFEYTKETIKKILAYKFDFIDKYLPTYKIILTKIWNSSFTGDYYFICSINLDKNNVYLMNQNNYNKYDNTGYVCDVPKNFISYFNLDNMKVINYPLPCNLKNKYEIGKNNKVNLKAMYTTANNVNFKSILPVLYINKNKND